MTGAAQAPHLVVIMVLIRDIVQQALMTGYLSVEAEEQLRQLLRAKYDLEDLNAFMTLQQAAMAGCVRQESRELISSHVSKSPKKASSASSLLLKAV
jgi:hypothetical protein